MHTEFKLQLKAVSLIRRVQISKRNSRILLFNIKRTEIVNNTAIMRNTSRKMTALKHSGRILGGLLILGTVSALLYLLSRISSENVVTTEGANEELDNYDIGSLNLEEKWIRTRLFEADKIWQKWNEKRQNVQQNAFSRTQWNTQFWNNFASEFNCPHLTERLGHIGPTGKWLCGFNILMKSTEQPCVVYSYSDNTTTDSNEYSFEEELLERASHCLVRIFDAKAHSISSVSKLSQKFPNRVHFYSHGLCYETSAKCETLLNEMRHHGDSFISVLKVDTVDNHFLDMEKLVSQFPSGLPIGQVLLRINLKSMDEDKQFHQMDSFWNMLRANGLRAFHSEPDFTNTVNSTDNKAATGHYVSFLNVKVDHEILHASGEYY